MTATVRVGQFLNFLNLWADEERLTFVPQLSNEQVLLLDLLL